MRAIVIDDERLARKELINLLNQLETVEVVGEAVNVEDAKEKIDQLNPDVIFLDIQMPEKTGFDLLEELDNVPHVIFTTAYDEYALKAFQVNALDYLLKPIEPKRLEEAIQRLSGKIENQIKREEEAASTNNKKLTLDDQVFVKDGDRCWFVRLSNVRLFESDGNYIKVYFDNFKPMIHKSLNALDERLDEKSFFRASRKHIINLGWVEGIEPWFNGGLVVTLKGGDRIEVSRRQAARFKEMMSL
ncbi:two component transcriptional regulator, LytTR family [Algoriphagus ornithinivorans]|jgi:two-component system LytT family response regulator|uniref:Two component transcriptional regulator, LytTR family n=1 Tax=Algoriphagus ornithinivorans TaxID=226506 RepID=A0A1I5E1V0_9BACT|nr:MULTISPECIES: response regulator [Algoriphagus]MAL15588.1 DNA-binding response regulator [Algoriphagus sp.]QYH40801.1 response regulator [Algoriphagus sp. NBT04N3]SFO05485.1 two component transcriptional regulator, LytTR family [Algoriphagus ornithinivorans]HAH38133.1 DNA-binding response regulator [Algoriphagus sp.]HAS58006.1 DNA-binding response regulator [Algoriphagus sp.]|tara:strand:- start:3976 stop:4710 length:735 start_codon:yes stop_codon:yes gene_type:complete